MAVGFPLDCVTLRTRVELSSLGTADGVCRLTDQVVAAQSNDMVLVPAKLCTQQKGPSWPRYHVPGPRERNIRCAVTRIGKTCDE
jgi:hypothetical protein